MPNQNENCPICGESSAVRSKLVLIDAPWELVPGGDSRKRYLVSPVADEVTPEAVQQRQVSHGYRCDHCGRDFAREWELASARNGRLLQTKKGSWVWLMSWVEKLPSHHSGWTAFTAFVLPILKACVDAKLDEHFRVGQSMSHIIFSTTDVHRLEKYNPSPLRVTIRYEGRLDRWYIAQSYRNILFSEPDHQDPIDSETAFTVLKSYLADLWRETRPGEALPGGLSSH
jgi:hypothetical protein